jgi:hypothetical protein
LSPAAARKRAIAAAQTAGRHVARCAYATQAHAKPHAANAHLRVLRTVLRKVALLHLCFLQQLRQAAGEASAQRATLLARSWVCAPCSRACSGPACPASAAANTRERAPSAHAEAQARRAPCSIGRTSRHTGHACAPLRCVNMHVQQKLWPQVARKASRTTCAHGATCVHEPARHAQRAELQRARRACRQTGHNASSIKESPRRSLPPRAVPERRSRAPAGKQHRVRHQSADELLPQSALFGGAVSGSRRRRMVRFNFRHELNPATVAVRRRGADVFWTPLRFAPSLGSELDCRRGANEGALRTVNCGRGTWRGCAAYC